MTNVDGNQPWVAGGGQSINLKCEPSPEPLPPSSRVGPHRFCKGLEGGGTAVTSEALGGWGVTNVDGNHPCCGG